MDGPEIYVFEGDGSFPNSRLPALVYRNALPADADAMIRAFAANGWSNAWVNGIFSYHHFHSIAHEVLGITDGEVRVALGGPGGGAVTLAAGDVVVVPAGVAHRNLGQSERLAVVGAYPGGAAWDVRRGAPGEYDAAAAAAASVSPFVTDPVIGGDGALRTLWAQATSDPAVSR